MDQSNLILGEIDITPLIKAKSKLDESILTADTWLEKTGAIQCFEYCYELSWKFMKKILFKKGVDYRSPKDVFRGAAQNKLIEDPEIWFHFIDLRNQTTHTYDDKKAEEVFNELPCFQTEFNKFLDAIKKIK